MAASGWTVDAADSEKVLARAGTEGLILRLNAGGSLAGRVVEAASGQPRQAELHVHCAGVAEMMTHSEEQGFELRGLTPGSYSILAKAAPDLIGFESGIAVRAGATTEGVVVALAPGARIRIRVDPPQDRHFELILDDGALFETGYAASRAQEFLVPQGTVTVRLLEAEGRPAQERRVETRLGSVAEVVFE